MKELISETSGSNCGYTGYVPDGEEWYLFRSDSNWGAPGEFLVAAAGQLSSVSRCHVVGQYIGIVNKQNFHTMRKYRVAIPYDCINGVCIPKTTYGTPGFYESLAGCQSSCGNSSTSCTSPNICVSPDYCPPGMVCLPASEFGTIEGLASSVKNKNCSS